MSDSTGENPAEPTPSVGGDSGNNPNPGDPVPEPTTTEPPKLPQNGCKDARDSEEGRHANLTADIRLSVDEHKSKLKRLTKKELVEKQDQLIKLFNQVKEAHHVYVSSIPNITEEQQAECDQWEAQFETDHESILQFTTRYTQPSSTSSSVRSSTSSEYTSVSTTKKGSGSAVKVLTEMMADIQKSNAELKAEMQKSNSDLKSDLQQANADFNSNLQQANEAMLDAFFHKYGQAMENKVSSTLQTFETTYLKPAQDLQQRVTSQVAEINTTVSDSLKKQAKTINEIAQDSQAFRSTLEALPGEIDNKVTASEQRLRKQITRIDNAQQASSESINDMLDQVKTLQSAVFKAEHRGVEFTSTTSSQPTKTTAGSSRYTSTPTARTIDSTISLRRKLLEGKGDATSDPSVTEHFQPNATYVAANSLGTTVNLGNAPSFETHHGASGECERRPAVSCCSRLRTPLITIKPFDGDSKNYARFKAKFMILYHKEFEDDASRLCMLEELLEEKVRNEIGECLTDSSMYEVIWDRLDAVYGRPEVMDQKYLNALLEIPPLKAVDATSLKTFANNLHGAVVTLAKSRYAEDLHSRTTMMVLEAKLPASLKDKWNLKKKRADGGNLNVLDFDDWISTRALTKEETKNIFTQPSTSTPKDSKSTDKKFGKDKRGSSVTSTINYVATSHEDTSDRKDSTKKPARDKPSKESGVDVKTGAWKCYVCQEGQHYLSGCPTFMKLSPTKRAEKVFKSSRCLSCLSGKHPFNECPRSFKCRVDGCENPSHHTMLHGSTFTVPEKTSELAIPSAPTPEVLVAAVKTKRRVLLKIVPLRVHVGDRSYETYGFLDTGSDTTLLRKDAAEEKLGLSGPTTRIKVKSFDGVVSNVDATEVQFHVSSLDGKYRFFVDSAYSIETLRAASNPPITARQQENWPHLSGFKTPTIRPEDVTVLLGMDVAAAHIHTKSIIPPEGTVGPIAFKTPFGWCLGGKMGPLDETNPFVAHISTSPEEQQKDLNDQVKKFWKLEAKEVNVDQPVLSEDDLRGQQILDSSIVHVGDRYQVGLMWKNDNVKLPNNRQVALKRLFSLERRFSRDAEFAKKYDAVVEEYVSLGHARLLSAAEAKSETSKTWYLPHHGVVNLSSSTTKVRVVFDGAAEHEDTSLNSNLLRGPNLLVSLLGVLLRFRRNLIPIGADIEKMFHQVKVPEEDQAALRFLYRTPGSSSPPLTYQMTVHIFGAVSSPTACIYALNRTADDNRKQFPEAAASVRKAFYVDNYLDSFDTDDEVVQQARQLKSLLQLGGFNLTKWMSSKKDILSELKPFGLALPTLDLDLDKLPIERTLGVLWNGDTDSFTFKIKQRPNSEEPLTKREFLSIISSLYDPLGLVAPVIFLMKSLLQEIWTYTTKIDWDDPLPGELRQRFLTWYDQLPTLEQLRIPRCFRFQRGKFMEQQLHVFTDASSKGYGAVAYFKTIYQSGFVDISFVMAKTHVTPTKGLTIPRLELQGAVEGLEIAFTVCRELDYDIDKVTFHVDSQTVLRWIHSRTCKFEVFVHNRVGKILRNTKRTQWRYVAGINNPADMCSRGIDPGNFDELFAFHQGPLFLQYDSSEWTQWPAEEIEEPDECDVNVIRVCTVKTEEEHHVIDRCVSHSSSKIRSQRVIGWCLRFIHNARAKVQGRKIVSGGLNVSEQHLALSLCIRRAQEIAFPEEFYLIRKGQGLSTRSKLLTFKPFIDGLGQLRIGGRLQNAPVDYSTKHPILLPADQPITRLIIWDHHVRNYHVKTERLLCDLRVRYWILSGRQTVRSVINKCIPCKRRDAQPVYPLMAPLPKHRLTAFLPAFAYTGIDYFGPLTVKVGGRGRRHEKRWICLFTCLTTRAVHLEVANSLNVDDFLLCFTRFKSLRGKPSVVYSDNGTNFVAAEKELREAFEELRQHNEKLKSTLACDNIEWHFSPPHGPHFGGVWERLVQTCKRAMKVTIQNRLVTDPVLQTVIAEVASLLNSRPLTHLSVDPEDPDPLTPNHFLHGGPRPYVVLTLTDLEDAGVSERQFEQSQAILNHFWHRWLKEYVPHLTERRKWSTDRPNIKVGDLVLVIEPNTPRGQWPLGVVLEVTPNAVDKVVRVAKVKVSTHPKPCVRPVTKLCVLSTTRETKPDVKSENKPKSTKRVHFE